MKSYLSTIVSIALLLIVLTLGNESNTGITFILAADCVREVLYSPRAMRLRDDILRRIGKNS
jgi:hypothetical protein